MLYPLLLFIGFSSSIALRSLDPLTVEIANDLTVQPATVALLGTALSIPYALSQPVLGPMGDHFGKSRVITIALWLLAISVFASALAPTFAFLMGLRVLTGIAAGGIVPIGQALIGDVYQGRARQIAIARSTMAVFIGQLVGASFSGILEAWIGWRGVLLVCFCFVITAASAATWKLPAAPRKSTGSFSVRTVVANYLIIFRMPRAWACYGSVFIQTGIMFGLMPFIAYLLERQNLGGAREAGLIIAGFSAGSLAFTLSVPITLRLLSRPNLLVTGGVITALGLVGTSFGLAWYWQAAIFLVTGFGYFLQHNAIQGEVSELSEELRASAYAMHAFSFFMGSAAAPILYGIAFNTIGIRLSLLIAAGIFITVGLTSGAIFAWFHRNAPREPTATGPRRQ